MSVGYVTVQWNGHKRFYDACMAAGVVGYLALFVVIGKSLFHGAEAISDEILLMRALGSCAFLMLNVVLCIGPLARLNRRFLPLLYNRRHLGVSTFFVALAHGTLALGFYHGFGDKNPFMSLLTSNTQYASLRSFPFQILGAAALAIMFLMAATSHDFWNRNLGARTWKSLHMLVYLAYGLLVMHVALGAMQTQRGPWLACLVSAAAFGVAGLHLVAGARERSRDRSTAAPNPAWIDAGDADTIELNRARVIVGPDGERIAVFRHARGLSAVTNVCAHQAGPLGEGKIIDGCVTCPWHGWTYRPEDGCAPPPFTEKVATYRLRAEGGRVWIDPHPLAPGTAVEPAPAPEASHAG